jgi:hypothetical protein
MNLLESDGEKLLIAVRDLLAAKGLVSSAEISERIAITDAANPGQGARMVAKAWTDPTYRALMLEDGTKAAEELGIPMRGAPPLGVLETPPRPTTSSSARCAAATRGRCSAIRRSGSSPPPIAPARFATRAAC